jgi:hypothetical protein
VSCSICEKRKEKRFCLAVHDKICPQCCGEQREITLDCPSSCPYLQQARLHEKQRSAGEIGMDALFANIEVGQQFLHHHEHLILGLSFALASAVHADCTLVDQDLMAALSALTKSYETLVNSGLVYETPTAGLRQQAVAAELQKMVREYKETEQKHIGHVRLRDQEVLQGLVFLVRMAFARTSGRPKSRAYIDFLAAQFPDKPPVGASESSLILP